MDRAATKRKWYAASAAFLLALLFFAGRSPHVSAKTIDCGLLQDCEMDGFYGDSGAGSGPWKIFKLSGTPAIGLHPLEGWPSGPSVWLSSKSAPFEAGIYQVVNGVTPGKGYHFYVAWAVEQVDGKGWQDWYQINRRLGIDPYGGTDPNSSNVQWSADYFRQGKKELAFDGYARSTKMTVFIRVTNPYPDHVVDVYLDSASLGVNDSMAPIEVTAPTATNPPPPPTLAAPATARPTQVAVEPTATDEPVDTPAPTDTVAPSPTAAPSATLKPTNTPTKVATRVRRTTPTPVPTPEETSSMNVLALSIIGLTSLAGVIGAGVLFLLAFVYWRRAK